MFVPPPFSISVCVYAVYVYAFAACHTRPGRCNQDMSDECWPALTCYVCIYRVIRFRFEQCDYPHSPSPHQVNNGDFSGRWHAFDVPGCEGECQYIASWLYTTAGNHNLGW
jgi:hypothetical protein